MSRKDDVKGGDIAYTPLPHASRIRKRSRFQLRQAFVYLIAFSLALTLTAILPTPWSLLEHKRAHGVAFKANLADPASEWKDDVWPIRPQTPWDISTDYAYPRSLEYDVEEGTWLRLDVHPHSGDIVFDMVGDLYCLPGADAYTSKQSVTTARPILLGVPHDSDPHFSPEGDRLVFRSDAGLGIENIWVMEWKGCDEMNLRPARDTASSPALLEALEFKAQDEDLLARGVQETPERKFNRLNREGRAGAIPVTNETYRWVTDARFHPSGSKVVATKWFTSSRSLGAGEGWEYSIPSVKDIRAKKTHAGSGKLLVGRTLPPGWTVENYGEQQIGPEQFIWSGSDTIIYAKNIRDESEFTYSKDVHLGIYAIFQRNLTTNSTETLVDAFPGGASRPELSRDRRTLAYVSRVRDKEALVLKDLMTGTTNYAWFGLTYDLSGVSAPMGTYPSFSFNPSDDAVIIWAAGQIYNVPLSVNEQGEKTASAHSAPFPIRFTAHIAKRLAKTRSGGADIVGLETKDKQRVRSFKELRVDAKGKKVIFQGAGATYIQEIGKKSAKKVAVAHKSAAYYSPSFIYGADDLIIHARWSETEFTGFEFSNITSGEVFEIDGLPLGRYFSPILCECDGDDRKIAFIKSGGSYLSGNIFATAGAGLYIGDLSLPKGPTKSGKLTIQNIRFIASDIDLDDRVSLRFLEKNKRLLVQQSDRAFVINLAKGVDEFGKYDHHTLASGKMSSELAASTRTDKSKYGIDAVAFVETFHVYLVPGKYVKIEKPLWSKPANATEGLVRLSLDGGHDIAWNADGTRLFWFLGPFLHSLEINKLQKCSSAIRKDHSTFGISCVKSLLDIKEVVVEHSTDVARLKEEASFNQNSDVVVYLNATLLTMATGDLQRDLVYDAALVTRGGVIESINSVADFVVPPGATVVNAGGGFVIPGFIDVHAHWNGFSDRYPATSWEMETFLAYGVTTLHNPSANNVDGFIERSRIESGRMIGPRIFTVGDVIYGGSEPGLHQDIADMDEAYSALIRIKAEGGPASISYKNYNLPARASRQRLLQVADNITMLCFPEGGMNYDWDLTYIVDGMTTIEHALPVPVLYEDVLSLYALSGTGATPTHIVNYGGAWGEQLVWATEDVPNDLKLRRFTRHDILERLTESTARPASSYAYVNTSISVAKMVEKGLRAHIGAHGEPPIGLNFHSEMAFTSEGGLSNYQVLQAATSWAAETLGIFPSLGSLSEGKLADFLVYPPGVDLLKGHISKTRKLAFVVRGGRVWDASTMEEVWPVKGRKQIIPPINGE